MSTYSICPKCEALNRVDATKALAKTATCGKCGNTLPMHSLVSEVDFQGLKRILEKSEQPVIVDFWAEWCGPCKAYAPQFERASVQNQNAVFLKVNTETNPLVSRELGIKGIPTTIVFKKGREHTRQAGALPEHLIGQLLN